MKILVISPPTFGKTVGGAAKDIFATAGLLVRMGHEVSFYAIATAHDSREVIDQVAKETGAEVRTFLPNLSRWGDWVKKVLLTPAYLDRASYVFSQLVEDADFQAHVDTFAPEVVMFFCSYGWPVGKFAKARGIPAVFRSHNWEPGFFYEALSRAEQWMPQNVLRYFAKYLGERNAAYHCDTIATIPFDDRWHYAKWYPRPTYVLTLTYLPDALRPPWVHAGKKPLDIVYLGASYAVSFHLRGAEMLIEQIAPEVERRAPGAFTFHICGSKLPKYLQAKCGTNVVYEGYVEDFEAFMSTMDIGAFPVFTGKSMKGKVFESLARAFPVVIPDNCLSGYSLDGTNVLLANTAEEFVSQIVVLRSDPVRKELSAGAAAFAEKGFSLKALSGVMHEVLTQVVERHR